MHLVEKKTEKQKMNVIALTEELDYCQQKAVSLVFQKEQ